MSFRAGNEINSYIIDRPLSRSGGMSQIFLAHDREEKRRRVALKVQLTSDENSAAFQELLRSEAQYLAKLRHPGIVHIYPQPAGTRVAFSARAFQYQGQPWYFAMEYIPGDSLAAHTKRISSYPLPWIIELFYQLLLTVNYLHQIGYAHCDLKPANILLREPPDPERVPRPVLVDFGSASEIERGVNHLTASLLYSPPEVVLALERRDIATNDIYLYPDKIDVWALGAIMFEIVTGRPLINKRRKDEITTTIVKGELSTISGMRPDAHQSLDKLLKVMLNRSPTQRPSVAEVIEAIEEKIASVRPPRIG